MSSAIEDLANIYIGCGCIAGLVIAVPVAGWLALATLDALVHLELGQALLTGGVLSVLLWFLLSGHIDDYRVRRRQEERARRRSAPTPLTAVRPGRSAGHCVCARGEADPGVTPSATGRTICRRCGGPV